MGHGHVIVRGSSKISMRQLRMIAETVLAAEARWLCELNGDDTKRTTKMIQKIR